MQLRLKARFSLGKPPFSIIQRPDYRRAKSTAEPKARTTNWTLHITNIFRTKGHLYAQLDPLDLEKQAALSETTLASISDGATAGTSELTQRLNSIYCQRIGYELGHIDNADEQTWLAELIESMADVHASSKTQRRIGRLILESEALDSFMAKRFGQVKRYGLEGCEALVVALDTLFHAASGKDRTAHAVIVMPHRGRLNVLVGLLGYPPEALFRKLKGHSELPADMSGDVLSHLAHQGPIAPGLATLLPNSSHLEAANPVGAGCAYGLGRYRGHDVLPVQIHGDAAFAGQGVVMETAQLSSIAGFDVHGTVHLVANNQLGFTTVPRAGRSSRYATDLAKMIGAPVLHVCADYPEEVARTVLVAAKYRERFGKDVFVDLIGYRRHGHNELDEPAFTQPRMYRRISEIEPVGTKYGRQLCETGVWTAHEMTEIAALALSKFDEALRNADSFKPAMFGLQTKMDLGPPPGSTGVDLSQLQAIGRQSVTVPAHTHVHPRLQKHHVEPRTLAVAKGDRIDWATAEALAVGTLLHENIHVRWCGQDVGRGTFSQRHFTIVDQTTEETIVPLNGLPSPAKLEIVNSPLSELGVLGFEYGLSIATVDMVLPVWEAQFGDFFNGAQVIFDAFLSSGQAKWGIQSGLVVLLPHGYDGAGPEHSSCRLERFLQMSSAGSSANPSNVNWHVANPTTPANYFHLLRRQIRRPFRKPLIVAAPKTLLRLASAVSSLQEMGPGTGFIPVIDDPIASQMAASQLVLVSGKAYYDLIRERTLRGLDDTMAIVRIEELCPFPAKELDRILAKHHRTNGTGLTWFQEEPKNMGAYAFIASQLDRPLRYVGRDAAAAPATGVPTQHKAELAKLYCDLFKL